MSEHRDGGPAGSAPEPRPLDDAKEALMDELCLFRADCERWLMTNGSQPDVARRADRILRLLNAQPVGAPPREPGEAVGRFGYGAGGVPAEEVCVLGLCETERVLLQPRAYRFVVMPGCARCAEMARDATDMPEANTAQPWITTTTTPSAHRLPPSSPQSEPREQEGR